GGLPGTGPTCAELECNGTKRRNHEDGQQAGSHGVSAMRPGGKALQSLPEPFLPANQRTPGRGKGKNRISKKNGENRLRHSQEQLGLRRFPQLYLGRLNPVQTKSSRQLFMGGHGGHRIGSGADSMTQQNIYVLFYTVHEGFLLVAEKGA